MNIVTLPETLIKSRVTQVMCLHRGAVIKARLYQNDRLKGLVLKEDGQYKTVWFK